MVAAVSEKFNHLVEQIIVIDCRYPYEFQGGHIKVGGACPAGRGSDPLVQPPPVLTAALPVSTRGL